VDQKVCSQRLHRQEATIMVHPPPARRPITTDECTMNRPCRDTAPIIDRDSLTAQ